MSSTPVTSPVKAAIQGAKGNGAQIVQIIKLPASLENTAKALRLEGQVSQTNPNNNTATVETNQGAVEVKYKGGRQPQVGQKVEIELSANNREARQNGQQDGRQLRNATIRVETVNATPSRNASAQTPQASPATTTNIQPQNITTPRDQGGRSVTPPPTNNVDVPRTTGDVNTARPQQAVPTTSSQESVNLNNLAQTAKNLLNRVTTAILPNTQNAQTAQPQNVNNAATQTVVPNNFQPLNNTLPQTISSSENIVRLLSVTPAQAQTIAKDFTLKIPAPVLNTAPTTSFTSSQTLPVLNNSLTTPALTTAPPQITAPTISTANNINTQIIPTTTAPVPVTNNATTLLPITPAPINQVLTVAQTIPQANISNFIPTQNPTLNATPQVAQQSAPNIINATLTPIAFDPSNPAQASSQRFSQIDIQIVKVTPPTAILTTPTLNSAHPIPAATNFTPVVTSANSAASISAQVTGFTQQGLPLITIQGLGARLPQSFVLQNPNSNLQLGSQLQIVPQNGTPIANQLSPLQVRALNNPLLMGFQWPAVDELNIALQQLGSQNAGMLSRALPNAATPQQIGPAAMVFIAAIKSGNFDMLLGDKKIDLLNRSGQSNILKSLTQDGARAGAPEPAVQNDWRAVPLPMFWEGEIHKITLYTRNESQQQQNEENEHGQTRFIFDLNLTRMGDVQIDGLIKDKRLDLVVRTQNAFSEPMQQTMRQAYSGALDQTDLAGELNFQGSTDKWVHVLEKEEQLGVSI